MIPPIELFRIIRRYYNDSQFSRKHPTKLFNYQLHNRFNYGASNNMSIEDHWLFQFITSRGYLKNKNKTISVFGINGDKLAIDINKSQYKIFYTIENVHVKLSPWNKYNDLLIGHKKINLSLGFDYINHPQYLRFPYWIMAMFSPYDNYDTIKQKCNIINQNKINIEKRNKFCSFICREDYFGDRSFFIKEVSQIGMLNCPGKFMHNDDTLKLVYGDNKIEYLSNFKFNLCPENSNNLGYVTEKIFEAVAAGCIPIYWGADNNPEPEILNQKSIFFLELNHDNTKTLNEMKELWLKPKLYEEFIKQNRLTLDAPEIIYEYYLKLDSKIREIVK